MSEMLKYLQGQLVSREKRLQKQLSATRINRRRVEALKDESGITYQVELLSFWANEGEQHVRSRTKGSVRKAIQRATTKFKKVNKRSDVQAQCCVKAIIYRPTHIEFPLPRKMWEGDFEEFRVYTPLPKP